MHFTLATSPLAESETDCIAAGILDRNTLLPSTEQLDQKTGGMISNALEVGDLKGSTGSFLLLRDLPGIRAKRVLLFGCGKKAGLTEKTYRSLVSGLLTEIQKTGSKNILLCLSEVPVRGRDPAWNLQTAANLLLTGVHPVNAVKKRKPKRAKLSGIRFQRQETDPPASRLRDALRLGEAAAKGMNFARDLADLPGNICTPAYLAEKALELGKNKQTRVRILEEEEMARLGMGALLSVSKGSREPAKLIIVDYQGGKAKQRPVVLVGKGLTFDAGGISLKQPGGMDEMKYDMCGGAAVLGALVSAMELRLPLNLVGIVPASENLPDGAANKPGDIVTSMSGQSIEILNTDAEGRLILCDALTYAEQWKPQLVIDVATLTGACIVALGKHVSAMLANDDALAEQLSAAGERSYDRVWRLPLWDEYDEMLKSNFADIPNVAGPEAGTITAACFLSRFTKKYPWAHLDIAGTAWKSGSNKGATGRPVGLLTQFLHDYCG